MFIWICIWLGSHIFSGNPNIVCFRSSKGKEDEAHLQRAGWVTFKSREAISYVSSSSSSIISLPCREKCMLRVMNKELGENTSQGINRVWVTKGVWVCSTSSPKKVKIEETLTATWPWVLSQAEKLDPEQIFLCQGSSQNSQERVWVYELRAQRLCYRRCWSLPIFSHNRVRWGDGGGDHKVFGL